MYLKQIPIDGPEMDFDRFLKIENNSRIIFSGKYGIGKSYFVQKFFEVHFDLYNSVFISPVNYAVNQSEDIFELIKVDIIKQLFENEFISFEDPLKMDMNSLPILYALKQPLQLLGYISKILSKLDPSMMSDKTIDATVKLIEDFKKFQNEVNDKLKTETVIVDEFASDYILKPGSYIENNLITDAIFKILEKIRGKKQNVLIIDDMDRIDPEHIFRILNVLGAHNLDNSKDYSLNKFGFDKTIIVCDINNIESIFRHRYGPKTDFDGYMGKFYSTTIFKFSNAYALSIYCQNFELDINADDRFFLGWLLGLFVKENIITVRNIIKHNHFDSNQLKNRNFSFANLKSKSLNNWIYADSIKFSLCDISFCKVIYLLTLLFGSEQNFIDALKALLASDSAKSQLNSTPENLVKAITLSWHLRPFFSNLESKNDTSNVFFDTSKGILDYPKGKILDNNYTIQLKWSMSNVYNSNEGYFNDYQIIYEKLENMKISNFGILNTFSEILESIGVYIE